MIANNKIINDEIATAILLFNDSYTALATSSMIVKNNKEKGKYSGRDSNHMFGIYSYNDNGILRQQQGTKIYGEQLYIENIAFGSKGGLGVIYENWTKENALNFNDELKKHILIKTLNNGISVLMKDNR